MSLSIYPTNNSTNIYGWLPHIAALVDDPVGTRQHIYVRWKSRPPWFYILLDIDSHNIKVQLLHRRVEPILNNPRPRNEECGGSLVSFFLFFPKRVISSIVWYIHCAHFSSNFHVLNLTVESLIIILCAICLITSLWDLSRSLSPFVVMCVNSSLARIEEPTKKFGYLTIHIYSHSYFVALMQRPKSVAQGPKWLQ